MMIKGSLLLNAPIVNHFRRKNVQCVLGQNLTVLGINRGLILPILVQKSTSRLPEEDGCDGAVRHGPHQEGADRLCVEV